MPSAFSMHFTYPPAKNKSILISSIFIGVMTTHLAILKFVWRPELSHSSLQVNVRFLESFTVHTENTHIEGTRSPIQVATHAPAQPTLEGQPEEVLKIKKIPPLDKHLNRHIPHSTSSGSLTAPSPSNTPPITHASYLNNPTPPYPRKSRRLGEQGKVVLAVEISTQGDAAQAIITTSSGHPRLDQAALETVLKWRFIPGKKAGVPQKMWVNIPINFVLE